MSFLSESLPEVGLGSRGTSAPGDRRFERTRANVERLLERMPQLAERLGEPQRKLAELVGWQRLIRYVRPHFEHEYPFLVAAIVGGHNAGKSTLLNYLCGRTVSPASFDGGYTRRVVLVGHPDILGDEAAVTCLLERFGERPQVWRGAEDCAVVGPPVYAVADGLPRGILLLDTPDFDSVLRENRQVTRAVLETAEVVLVLFTNATYKAEHNLRFLGDEIRAHGGRVVIFLYRASEAISAEVGRRHMRESAEYLGIEPAAVFRIAEDNAVALGRGAPTLEMIELRGTACKPAVAHGLDQAVAHGAGHEGAGNRLLEVLGGLDAVEVKRANLRGDLRLAVEDCGRYLDEVQRRLEQVAAARRAVLEHVGEAAAEVAAILPDRALKQLLYDEWQAQSGAVALWVGRVAHFVALPGRALGGLVSWLRRTVAQAAKPANVAFEEQVGVRLEDQAHRLYTWMQDRRWPVEGEAVPAWEAARRALTEGGRRLPLIHESLREFCRERVARFRESHRWSGWVIDLLSAAVKLAPAATAIVYTVITVDPLTGLVLAHTDVSNLFWLLLQAPINDAVKQALRWTVLQPLYQEWHEQRLVDLQELLRSGVAGGLLERLEQAAAARQEYVECREALAEIREVWLQGES